MKMHYTSLQHIGARFTGPCVALKDLMVKRTGYRLPVGPQAHNLLGLCRVHRSIGAPWNVQVLPKYQQRDAPGYRLPMGPQDMLKAAEKV